MIARNSEDLQEARGTYQRFNQHTKRTRNLLSLMHILSRNSNFLNGHEATRYSYNATYVNWAEAIYHIGSIHTFHVKVKSLNIILGILLCVCYRRSKWWTSQKQKVTTESQQSSMKICSFLRSKFCGKQAWWKGSFLGSTLLGISGNKRFGKNIFRRSASSE